MHPLTALRPPLTAPTGAIAARAALAPVGGSPVASFPQDQLSPGRATAILRLQALLAAEATLPLQNGSRSQLLLQPQPTGKGTVVLLHGWSAGTYQYELLAPQLLAQGFDVYIPRLPGHGFQKPDGSADASQLLRSHEFMGYRQFADELMEQVRGLGGPIQVVGLSGGGNVALDMAARYPELKGAVVMAPYLGSADPKARFGHHLMWGLDQLTFGQGSRFLNRLTHSWGPTPTHSGAGHWEHPVGAIYAIARYGDAVMQALPNTRVPIQFITTANDRAASPRLIGEAYVRTGGAARNGFFEFPASDTVPHPMLHPLTNPNARAIETLNQVSLRFLDGGQFSQQPPAPQG
ncbi:MAG: alpha/beta fold hydrolase [Candidatus Sericytochromatia bacterium]|nr:alpha/beta fold hydrolase [Candidatus Sericytochromatia bacterium]